MSDNNDVLQPPDSEARNRHHMGNYRSIEEFYDSNFPRGTADPDYRDYPGQDDPNYIPTNKRNRDEDSDTD